MARGKKRRRALRLLATAAVILLTLTFLQKLLTPKYVSQLREGSLIAGFYKEKIMDHDVIFLGDCEVYESFSPKVLWEEYGINSYIRGSAQQLIWQSYFLLEDTLRYEAPKAVVFNVLAMQYDEPQREAYNRMTLEGMEWSAAKLRAVLASMTEEEHLAEYVFPLLRYHSRWRELTEEDWKYLFTTPSVSHNGYLMHVETRPAQTAPQGRLLPDYRFGENAWLYLKKMTALCQGKGIRLILMKAPSIYPCWYPQWEEQIQSFARENGLPYFNFQELGEETGVDLSTDTYDGGLHLNLSGAEKLTRWLGEYLHTELGLEDRRGEPLLAALWQEKIDAYEAEKAALLAAAGQ